MITHDLGITHTALGSLTTVMYAVGAVLSAVAGRHYSGLALAGAAVFGISVPFGKAVFLGAAALTGAWTWNG